MIKDRAAPAQAMRAGSLTLRTAPTVAPRDVPRPRRRGPGRFPGRRLRPEARGRGRPAGPRLRGRPPARATAPRDLAPGGGRTRTKSEDRARPRRPEMKPDLGSGDGAGPPPSGLTMGTRAVDGVRGPGPAPGDSGEPGSSKGPPSAASEARPPARPLWAGRAFRPEASGRGGLRGRPRRAQDLDRHPKRAAQTTAPTWKARETVRAAAAHPPGTRIRADQDRCRVRT